MKYLTRLEVTETDKVEELDKRISDVKSEIRRLTSKSMGKTMGKGFDKKETGLIRMNRRALARLLTRKNQLDKGFCTKGGLHMPFQARDNSKMCLKCRQKLSGVKIPA